jgi:hypothetical protein
VLNSRDIALRGYQGNEAALQGRSARVASLEWRQPLADLDRHAMVPPLGINRLSAALFIDAGRAWTPGAAPLADAPAYHRGVGLELLAELKLAYSIGLQARPGLGPGPGRTPWQHRLPAGGAAILITCWLCAALQSPVGTLAGSAVQTCMESRMRTSPSLAPLLALLLAALTLSGCVVAPRYDSPDGPRYRRPPPAQAQAPAPAPAPMYFYPMRNQSEAQQERDRYECYRWAVHQSGIDPGMTPITGQPAASAASRAAEPDGRDPRDPRDGRSVVAGAATGAVAGAVLSGSRHSGQGAVMGAIFGALMGAAVEESPRPHGGAAAGGTHAAHRAPNTGLDNFRRAMSACMDARGYRVSAP